jgi:hypothetical protein
MNFSPLLRILNTLVDGSRPQSPRWSGSRQCPLPPPQIGKPLVEPAKRCFLPSAFFNEASYQNSWL